eukprot:scaffold1916_cov123-Isochrysis_galbana.AAC.8
MAPRQLFSQPMEDENDPEPGSKRVRPSSADEGSMQVRLRACASACGTSWPGIAHWLALLALPWKNSAHAVERTMAPRQLSLPPMEAEMNPEPGSQRVRPSSADESSMQVRLRARASAFDTLWPGPAHWLALLALAWANGQSSPLLAREKCAAKTLMSVAAPPFTTIASAVHYTIAPCIELFSA